jgi:hypothetical protein
LTPVAALLSLFGFKKEKLEEDYTKHNIQEDFDADKKPLPPTRLNIFPINSNGTPSLPKR